MREREGRRPVSPLPTTTRRTIRLCVCVYQEGKWASGRPSSRNQSVCFFYSKKTQRRQTSVHHLITNTQLFHQIANFSTPDWKGSDWFLVDETHFIFQMITENIVRSWGHSTALASGHHQRWRIVWLKEERQLWLFGGNLFQNP